MISKITFGIIFDKNDANSDEMEQETFIKEYVALDQLLEEVFLPAADEALGTSHPQVKSVLENTDMIPDHKTKVKQILRRQKHKLK